MTTFQKIFYMLLGTLLAVGIFCLVVWIGCSVNQITFAEQIVKWFGTTPAVDEAIKTAVIKPLI